MDRYNLISADSHVVEAPDLWEKWLPKEFQPKAPKLVKDSEDGDAWQYRPGTPPVPLGLVTTYPGRTYENFKWTGARYDRVNAGAFVGAARVKEQKIDGVDAEVLYPSQRTMRHFMLDEDDQFHKAGIRAYNDWMAKEFMAADPTRLIGLAQMPNLGVQAMLDEMHRTRKMGMRGVILSSLAERRGVALAGGRRFLDRVREARRCRSASISACTRRRNRRRMRRHRRASRPRPGSCLPDRRASSATRRRVSATCRRSWPSRFSRGSSIAFRVSASSPSRPAPAGCPYFLEQMDDRWFRNRHWAKVPLEMLPSEYFKRNWLLTFVQDFYGVRNRHAVGVDNMMWSTDYPHHISDWP